MMEFMCMYCDFSCTSHEENIQLHMKEVHPDEDPMYITQDPSEHSHQTHEQMDLSSHLPMPNDESMDCDDSNDPTEKSKIHSCSNTVSDTPEVAALEHTCNGNESDTPQSEKKENVPEVSKASSSDSDTTEYSDTLASPSRDTPNNVTDLQSERERCPDESPVEEGGEEASKIPKSHGQNSCSDVISNNETFTDNETENQKVSEHENRDESSLRGADEQVSARNFETVPDDPCDNDASHMHVDSGHPPECNTAVINSNGEEPMDQDMPTMKILEAHSIADDPDFEGAANGHDDNLLSTGTLYLNYNHQGVDLEASVNNVPGVLSQANDNEQNDPTLPRITCVEAQVDFAFVGDDDVTFHPVEQAFDDEKQNSDSESVSDSFADGVYSHRCIKSSLSQTHPTMRSLLSSPTKTHPQLATVLTQPNNIEISSTSTALDIPTDIPVNQLASIDGHQTSKILPVLQQKEQRFSVIRGQSSRKVKREVLFDITRNDKSDERKSCERQKSMNLNGWYQCMKCSAWFCSIGKELRDHMSSEHKLSAYQCKLCKYNVSRLDKIQLHMNGFHSMKTVKCLHCQEGFGTVTEVKKHLKNSHHVNLSQSGSDFTAVPAVCVSQTTKGYNEMHLKQVKRKLIPYICCVHKKNVLNTSLKNNSTASVSKVPKKPPNKVIKNDAPLSSKIKTDDGLMEKKKMLNNDIVVKPVLGLFCKECHFFVDGEVRRSEKADILESHMVKEHNILRYQCNECDFNTSERDEIRKHVRFQHVMWTYKCRLCRRYWAEESQMVAHIHEKHCNILKRKSSKCYTKVQDMCFSERYHDVTLQLYTASVMPDTGLTNFEATQDYSYNIQCKFCTCFMGNCEHDGLVFAMKNHVERCHPDHEDMDPSEMYDLVNVVKGQSEESESGSNSEDESESDEMTADIKDDGNDKSLDGVDSMLLKHDSEREDNDCQGSNDVSLKQRGSYEVEKEFEKPSVSNPDAFTEDSGVVSAKLGIRVYPRNKKSSGMGFRTYACSFCGFAVMGNVNFTKKKKVPTATLR